MSESVQGPFVATAQAPVSRGRAFARHFAEMFAAMLVGMGIVMGGLAAAFALSSMSYTEGESAHPVIVLVLMGLGMTVPMVAWMRRRRHAPRLVAEMTAAMVLVTLVLILVAMSDLVANKAAAEAQHMGMIVAMLAAMLVRRDAYSRGVHASDR